MPSGIVPDGSPASRLPIQRVRSALPTIGAPHRTVRLPSPIVNEPRRLVRYALPAPRHLMDLDPPCPRYTGAPLPPYRYIPGRSPHPRSDPRGHSHGRPEARSERLDPADWARSETWKRAVDLHNFGYFWEAHEALEILWRGAGGGGPRPGLLADFFQGLIQICAAHVKHALGVRSAVDALLARALPRLAGAPSPFLGMDLRAFERDTIACFRGERDAPPRITLALPGRSAPEQPDLG